jgi:hypothetical protein
LQDVDELQLGGVHVAFAHLVGAGRGKANDVGLAEAAGGESDAKVAILRIGAQTVGFEVAIIEVGNGEGLRSRGCFRECRR